MKKQAYIDLGLHFWLKSDLIERTLCEIFHISKKDLFCKKELSVNCIYEVQKAFYALKNGKPEAYTLEKADFYGRKFYVNNEVLIPRNDTEVLVRNFLNTVLAHGNTKGAFYVDVWTGSGCIPISVIHELEPLKFDAAYALDISKGALTVAQKNIETHAKGRIDLRESNLLDALYHEESLYKKHMYLTANLPYIKEGDFENMDVSVMTYEPNTALYGWKETGFELYEVLIKQCFQLKQIHTMQDIHMFIEIWFDQKDNSQTYLQELWLSFEYFKDDANIDRIIHIYGF